MSRFGRRSRMTFRRIMLVLFGLCSLDSLRAQEPDVSSVFPSSGQQGSTVKIEIGGRNLRGTYTAQFDCKGMAPNLTVEDCDTMRALIREVEEVADDDKGGTPPSKKEDNKALPQRLVLQVQVDRAAKIGAHVFQLVSPAG